MDLNEYIKMSYKRPNRKVLEGLGASEDLIEYLMETPGNTNWNMVDSITNSGGGGGAEVWLTGDTYTDKDGVRFFTLSDVGGTNHISELYDNGDNYQIFLNGGEVSYSATIENPEDTIKIYADGDTPQTATKTLAITRYDDASKPDEAAAQYPDIATAPDSVEVSVKAK